MLQQNKPKDYVIATGNQISVREFVNLTAKELDIEIKWQGKGKDEVGIWKDREIIKIDTKYYRPNEVESLLGDAALAYKDLNWKPNYNIQKLVSEMVKCDLEIV